MTSVFVLGMVVAFLLGNLPNARQARVGLAFVLGGAAIVVYNAPGHPASQLVFIPILFGICVMVLQVGAVRRKLPDTLAEDRYALRGVEQAGRAALTEMRRLLAVMRRDRGWGGARSSAWTRRPRFAGDRDRPGGTAGPGTRRRRAVPTSRRGSNCPPTGSCRRASPTRSSTPAPVTHRSPSTSPRTRSGSRCARGSPRGGTPSDTAASFSAPEPHLPRLITGNLKVSSKRGNFARGRLG
jgi:hypothetical protein